MSETAFDFFDRVFYVSPRPFEKWYRIVSAKSDMPWSGLSHDPSVILPSVRSIIVLVKAYRPYRGFSAGEVQIDAYYPASQEAYLKAKELTNELCEQGQNALWTPSIPAKAALLRSGQARYGRNGLLSVDGIGTMICIQTVLTDYPYPNLDAEPDDQLYAGCRGCGKCAEICPGKALKGDCSVDVARCLRGQSYTEAMPEAIRPLIGASLLGCNICQINCPRNAGIEPVDVPGEVREAIRLERLLDGDGKPLSKLIGTNYARSQRMQARAALLAGNLNRRDTMDKLTELAGSHPSDLVRLYAEWSLKKLYENNGI